jgi:hypothetical protein
MACQKMNQSHSRLGDTIEEASFLLFEVIRCPQNLFGDERFVHMHKPLDPNAQPKIQNNKAI